MYESQIKNSFFPNIFFRRPEQFGFVRVCFGFVFTKCLIGFIFIILCNTDVYIHLTLKEFGFVLHNSSLNSLSISPLFRPDMTKNPCFPAFLSILHSPFTIKLVSYILYNIGHSPSSEFFQWIRDW